jgi:hypothetical protein
LESRQHRSATTSFSARITGGMSGPVVAGSSAHTSARWPRSCQVRSCGCAKRLQTLPT